MGNIQVLPFSVANRIAAGEVVERPASAIKELIENAMDADAHRITVEIQNGGLTFMRVTDDGCGMSAEDLAMCIRRHATSKITSAADLETILTMGFRGEALAAIASVCELRILSRRREDEMGNILEASQGNLISVRETGCMTGTTVIVEELFASVPARRKFMRRDATEAQAVGAMVEKLALARPDIAFRLIVDGNTRLQTAGDGNLKAAIHAALGKEFANRMIEVKGALDGVEIAGYISRPDFVKGSRSAEHFFINHRYVRSAPAASALEQAYHSFLASERFPACVLHLTMRPETVDFNVHPAKLEVKFSRESAVFTAIYTTVRSALSADETRPELQFAPNAGGESAEKLAKRRTSDAFAPVYDARLDAERRAKGGSRQDQMTLTEPSVPPPAYVGSADNAPPDVLPSTTPPAIPPEAQITPQERAEHNARRHAATITGEEYAGSMISGRYRGEPTETTPPTTPAQSAVSAPSATPPPSAPAPSAPPTSTTPAPSAPAPSAAPTSTAPVPAPSAAAPTEATSVILPWRIVGQVFHAYVIVEMGDKMLMIDQHAAHERLLYEQLRARMNESVKASQPLVLPLEVMLMSDEVAAMEEYRRELEAIGFSYTAKRNVLLVDAIPAGVESDRAAEMLSVIAEQIRNNTGSARLTRDILFERALYQGACKAAIKAGRAYPPEHIEWLVEQLMRLPDITVCPHGRPVAMQMSKQNIDHQFERS